MVEKSGSIVALSGLGKCIKLVLCKPFYVKLVPKMIKNKKAFWLLAMATAAMLVSLTRAFPAIALSADVTDFSTGLAAALMVGVLVHSRRNQFTG